MQNHCKGLTETLVRVLGSGILGLDYSCSRLVH